MARALAWHGHDVLVAAPATNMSGAGAAIGPIDPRVPAPKVEIPGHPAGGFAVQAPPAMIVISALQGAFGKIPDAVVSGVNDGVNLGRAILHSGTVGAALTGQNLGLPSVAVSLAPGGDWTVAADHGVEVFEQLLRSGATSMANVNVPADATSSTPRVRAELARFGEVTAGITGEVLDFLVTIDPAALDEPGTDAAALFAGQVSVTWLQGFGSSVEGPAEVSVERVPSSTQGR